MNSYLSKKNLMSDCYFSDFLDLCSSFSLD